MVSSGMRVLAVIAAVVVSGCVLPTNEISGRWNVGGPEGCTKGESINVSAPGLYGEETVLRTCTDRTFSILVDGDLHELSVRFDVWPLVDVGDYRGAIVGLTRVIDDFNIGLVYFETFEPEP